MMNKKIYITVVVIVFLVACFLAYWLFIKGDSTPIQQPTDSVTKEQSKWSLSNGRFYQSLKDGRYSMSFIYPIEWGEVEYYYGFFDGTYLDTSNNQIIGRYVFGTFSNNKGVYFVGRSAEYNASPSAYADNLEFYSSTGLQQDTLDKIYNQAGASGCVGDGGTFQEEIDTQGSTKIVCPVGGETQGTSYLLSPTFNVSETSKIGIARILPDKLSGFTASEHIAVVDLPISDFGTPPTDLYAVAFVNLNNETLPDPEYINMVKTVRLH